MESPQLIVGSKPKDQPPVFRAEQGWPVLGWFAVLLILVGLVDIGLAFGVVDLSEPGLRFTVLAGVIGGLPLLSIGLVMHTIAALGMGSRRRLLVSWVGALLLIGLITGTVIGFAGAHQAVRAAVQATDQATITRMVWRTGLFAIAYGALYIYTFLIAFRAFRSARVTT